MATNSGRLVVVLIVIVAIGIVFLMSQGPPPTGEIQPADSSTTIELEPEWETALTTVYVYDGDLFFGGPEVPHSVLFFIYSTIDEGVAVAPIDKNDYYFVFSEYSNSFDVFGDAGAFFGSHSFNPGEISSEPLKFGEYNKDYYYYVSADGKRMIFFLGAQGFELQFGKRFYFEGTDSSDDGDIDLPYFYPALEEFGYSLGEKAGTAVFAFDEDGDEEAEARLYLDTSILKPIEEDSRDSYNWQVVFLSSGRWLGYNLEEGKILKQNSYGSVIGRSAAAFYIKMPAKDIPLSSLMETLEESEEDFVPIEIEEDLEEDFFE